MFIEKIINKNSELVKISIDYHQKGIVLPDTFVIDLDTLLLNSKKMLDKANENNIELYFMLKQLGRNPYIAKKLVEIGYKGAVVVDYKEAIIMMENNIPISNVGHLVQTPLSMIQSLIDYGCEYFTVFSIDKIRVINECAKKRNIVQKIILKVVDENDFIYSGQTAGFSIDEIIDMIPEIKKMDNIKIDGLTSFPCFLYKESTNKIEKTKNIETLLKCKETLMNYDIEINNLNTPSATCCTTIDEMVKYGSNSGEPGHGLTASTPYHEFNDCVEIPCVVYVSEVSHNYKDNAYFYGGGYYRRGHIKNALVGNEYNNLRKLKVILPNLDSIDYYFGLETREKIHDAVILSFRYQIFVTRSDVCLIEGLHSKQPKIIGIYNSLGYKKNE